MSNRDRIDALENGQRHHIEHHQALDLGRKAMTERIAEMEGRMAAMEANMERMDADRKTFVKRQVELCAHVKRLLVEKDILMTAVRYHVDRENARDAA